MHWINLKSVDWNKNECKNTWYMIVKGPNHILKFYGLMWI